MTGESTPVVSPDSPPAGPEPRRRRAAYALFLAAAAFIYLQFVPHRGVHTFPDSYEYIEGSKPALTDPRVYTAPRPALPLLFYKLVGTQPESFVPVQQAVDVLAWASLGLAAAWVVRRALSAGLALAVFALYSLSWNIAGWAQLLLSESLTLSLFAAVVAMTLLWLDQPSRGRWAGLAGASVLFALARDNTPWLALVWGGLLAGAAGLTKAPGRRVRLVHAGGYLLVALAVAAVQAAGASAGRRFERPLGNVILQRILPDAAYAVWFRAHGMPDEATRLNSGRSWIEDLNATPAGPAHIREFVGWLRAAGRGTYARFLIEHPAYVFGRPWRDRELVFARRLRNYVAQPRPMTAIQRVAEAVGTPGDLRLVLSFVLTGIASGAFFRGGRVAPALLLPAGLWAAAIANGLMCYHADAMEVARHCFLTAVGANTAMLVAMVLLLDGLLGWEQARLAARTTPRPTAGQPAPERQAEGKSPRAGTRIGRP